MVLRALLTLTFVVSISASASAATVEGTDDYGESVVVTDSTGERNRLELSDGEELVVREHGRAPLVGSGTCRNVEPRVVRCAETGEIEVLAGSGDDTVDGSQTWTGVGVIGGPGDDRIAGGRGGDELRGGDGDDMVAGGAGPDNLHGGPGSDRLDGGRGADSASWSGDRGPLRADLRRGTASSADGRDRLLGVERLTGTDRDDHLAGNAGANRLDGGDGADRLIGRGGPDRLATGTLDGRADGDADRLECGAGVDTVADAGHGTFGGARRPEPITPDCEQLEGPNANLAFETIRAHPVERDGGRRVEVQAVCNPEYSRCRLRATLVAAGRVLGRSSLRRVRPTIVRLRMRLRRPLPTAGVVTVRVNGSWGGSRYAFTYRVRRGRAHASAASNGSAVADLLP